MERGKGVNEKRGKAGRDTPLLGCCATTGGGYEREGEEGRGGLV